MQQPTTIREEGTRWTIDNARPRNMRIVIGVVAPIAIAFVGLAMVSDFGERHFGMFAVRALFVILIAVSAMFSLFGAESLAVEGDALVWRRGSSQQRRCPLGELEKLEREGNQLRVHVRGEKQPIVIGAGLRQQPAAMQWLLERVQAAITAAQKGR